MYCKKVEFWIQRQKTECIARLILKQNSKTKAAARGGIREGGGRPGRGGGRPQSLGRGPYWAPHDTRPIGSILDRKRTLHLVDDSRWLRPDMGVRLDPLENRHNKLSMEYLNAPIGVRMKSCCPFQIAPLLQSESNSETCGIWSLSFHGPKSDVVA